MQETINGYPENRVHLYADMMEYKREMISPSNLVNKDLWKKHKSFNTQLEAQQYLSNDKELIKSGHFSIGNIVYKGNHGYSSVFFYSKEEMETHFQLNGGPSAFKGGVYSHWLYADLDPAINHQFSSMQQMIAITDIFKKAKIPIIAYYTGNKGMHIYIPIQACKYPSKMHNKAHLINYVFWNKIKEMADKAKVHDNLIDPQIWAVNTIFRHPYTIHNKSGKLKALMVWNSEEEQWVRMPNDEDFMRISIKELIFPSDYSEITPIVEIKESDIDIPIPKEQVWKDYFPAPYREKVCIYKLMNTILYEGEHRNESMMRMMSYWKHEKELPNRFVWKFMNEWNKQHEPPLKESELKSIFGGIERYNFNMCKDPLMDNYCCKNRQCHLWDYKSGKQLGNSIIDALTELKEDLADTTPSIDLGQIFETLPVQIRPSRGQIVTLIAGSGVGKTTLALNVAVFAKVPTVMISYEISKIDLIEAMGLMLGIDPINDPKAFYEKTKHIFIIDRGMLALQEIEREVQMIEELHRIKISMLVIDYIQIMPVFQANNPNKTIDGLVQKIDEIARILPEIVKTNNWAVFMLAQPKQSVDVYGSNILLENSGKGGQQKCVA